MLKPNPLTNYSNKEQNEYPNYIIREPDLGLERLEADTEL
jgi:hypothetical protein